MAFLAELGKIVNDQFGFGENSASSLTNKNIPNLNNFLGKIDRTAQRNYIEDGFIGNIRPRMREVLWQEPDLTVIIKKRMFSSLAENFRLDLLEENERLFIRAAKRLFQNKCRLIAAYERLVKIERFTTQSRTFNSNLIPQVITAVSELEAAGFQFLDPEARSAIETLRKVFAYSDAQSITNWVSIPNQVFVNDLGEGSGVIELTLVHQVNTTVSTEFAVGNATLTIEDPYKLMVITNEDIDTAISDASNYFKNSGFGRFTEIETKRLIEEQKQRFDVMRSERGASAIRFITSPNTIVSKRLRAIMDAEGREIKFQFNPGLLGISIPDIEFGGETIQGTQSGVEIDPTEFQGKHGLTQEEVSLFCEIVKNIFLLMGFENVTNMQLREFNEATNYVRRKMRLHFSGKYLIQHMDIVNIFMTAKTRNDDNLTHGFKSVGGAAAGGNFNIRSKIDNLINNINTSIQNINGLLSGDYVSPDELEKAAIVGPDFPTWLWKLFKNDFTKQAAGTCVFVGLVKSVDQQYSNGTYRLSVTCEDNAGYFNKSQTNIKPAVDVFNRELYDPLTPFKVNFDAATGVPITSLQNGEFPPLLDENILLLNSEAVRFNNGRFRGLKANELNYKAKDAELSADGFRRVLNDPHGFVYRWKEGIGSLTFTGRPYPQTNFNDNRTPLLTANPFAGQDVMNVLSLLITGQPYNYNSFLKAAIDNGNSIIGNDEISGSSIASTYIDGLIGDLESRNTIWGNFIPFKKLIMNDEATKFITSGQADFITQNLKINELLRRRAKLLDDLALQSVSFANQPLLSRDSAGQFNSTDVNNSILSNSDIVLRQELDQINQELDIAQRSFSNAVSTVITSKPDGGIKIIGDDISYDPSLSDSGSSITTSQQQRDRKFLRDKLKHLTLRRLWKVKANEDPNLFITDDQYDRNYDIQAYERKLNGSLNLLQSEYTTIDSQIRSVAALLGLEVFANSQGHIEVRPPQYNKIPSTVFYNMLKLRERTGIQIFPQFLESLFFNQLQGVINRLEIVEDEIRLRGTALGLISSDSGDLDQEIRNFLRGSSITDLSAGAAGFAFLSDPVTGKIGNKPFQLFIQQSKPDLNEEYDVKNFEKALQININANRSSRLFDSVARAKAVQRLNVSSGGSLQQRITDRIFEIRERLQKEKGVQAITTRELFSDNRFKDSNSVSQVDTLNIVNQIAQLVAERQNLLLAASNSIKNLSEGLELNRSPDKGSSAALFPSLNRKTEIPPILEHMIEDERVDDIGPGSSARFTIKESQIISLSISENPPPFTLVQVNGRLGEGFVDPPNSLTSSSGGNAVTTAYAVDYDMWRMYGFRAPNSVEAPFFSDPDTQCAPYAVYLLNLARKNILQGSITVIGNEYYQAGDVVYIEDRDLLFYVSSVQHQFQYGGNFQTTLSLKYGHTPGEYIPTILDIVGKILYNSKGFTTQFRSARFDNANGDKPAGVLIFDNKFDGQGGLNELLQGSRGEQNKKVLGNLLLSASGLLNQVGFRSVRPKMELRVYTSSKTRGVSDSNLLNTAEAVRTWLINPEQYSIMGKQLIPDKVEFGLPFTPDTVSVVEIDVANEETDKSPSSAAWNAARLIRENPMPQTAFSVFGSSLTLDSVLYTHIIDAWIVLEEVTDSISTAPNTSINQAAQEAQATLNTARLRRNNT